MARLFLGKTSLVITVLVSLLGFWCFSGPVQALTQIGNWAFTGNATGWTGTNGQGTDECGTTTSTNRTNMATFGYDLNTWRSVTGSTQSTVYKGMIHQTFIAPGSSNVKVKGRVNFSTSVAGGGSWSGYVRIDLYDSTNTTHIANLSCESFTSAQSSHDTVFGEATLTGGSTYTVRVTMAGTVGKKALTFNVDDVVMSTAPTGLSVTADSSNTQTTLSWTESTAGSGAPNLHSSTPYNVYRDTSSPVSTFLASSATNSFTDSTAIGNTTYYYAVTNIDSNSIESPLSGEASVLTRPGAPATPTFSALAANSLTVSWGAPQGGASSYTVERCSSLDCTDFAVIATGVTGTTYNDSGLSGSTLYRYRVRGINATGGGEYSGVGEATTTTAAVVSVTITSDGIISYGVLGFGETKSTIDLADTQVVKNDGNVSANLNIKSSVASGGAAWSLGTSAGNNIFVHEFSLNSGSNWTKFANADSYQSFLTGLTVNATQHFDLRLTAPNPSTDTLEKTVTITIQAVEP